VVDDDLLQVAMAVRRGSTRLARRLRMERPDPLPARPGPGTPELGFPEPRNTELGTPELGTPELSNQALGILAHLYRRGPMTPGALAAAERLQPQSLTRTLARLERQRLIARRPDEQDRRRSVLALTDAGRQALVQDMRQRDSWLADAMAQQLTAAERDLLRIAGELMDRLADAGELPGSPPAHDHAARRRSAPPIGPRPRFGQPRQ
jgi:DNA-binding MarR family transcriptional regulator